MARASARRKKWFTGGIAEKHWMTWSLRCNRENQGMSKYHDLFLWTVKAFAALNVVFILRKIVFLTVCFVKFNMAVSSFSSGERNHLMTEISLLGASSALPTSVMSSMRRNLLAKFNFTVKIQGRLFLSFQVWAVPLYSIYSKGTKYCSAENRCVSSHLLQHSEIHL